LQEGFSYQHANLTSAISSITWLRGTGDSVGMVKLHIFSVEFEADHW